MKDDLFENRSVVSSSLPERSLYRLPYLPDKCPVCGKNFSRTSEWVYKYRDRGIKFVCSYKCLRAKRQERREEKEIRLKKKRRYSSMNTNRRTELKAFTKQYSDYFRDCEHPQYSKKRIEAIEDAIKEVCPSKWRDKLLDMLTNSISWEKASEPKMTQKEYNRMRPAYYMKLDALLRERGNFNMIDAVEIGNRSLEERKLMFVKYVERVAPSNRDIRQTQAFMITQIVGEVLYHLSKEEQKEAVEDYLAKMGEVNE